MKSMLFFLLFVLVNCFCSFQVVISVEHHFFTQRLNHLDKSDNRTWKQKYFVHTTEDVNNAPSILGIIDGANIEAYHIEEGLWMEQAKRLKTNLYVVDLRFYGFSRPTENLSDENLKYFSLEQMVGDMVYFMNAMDESQAMKNPDQNRSKRWIMQGCGLSGIVTTLIRVQYPDLVIGAAILRAPVNAVMETPGYYVNAFKAFREESRDCESNIRKGFKELSALMKTASGVKQISNSYQLCTTVEGQTALKDKDANILVFLIAHLLTASLTSHRVQLVSSIHDVCKVMNNKNIGTPYTRLAKAYEMLRKDRGEYCTPLYEGYIGVLKDASWVAQKHGLLPHLRQWKYLQCFEAAIYTTSTDVQDILSGNYFDLDFLLEVCNDAYTGWDRENLEKYAASTRALVDSALNNVTNLAFLHERSDPYSSVYYYTTNPKSVNIDIEGPGNCHVLDKPQLGDRLDVRRARRQLTDLAVKWAQET